MKLHIFMHDEFVKMWSDLGLIRKKVSQGTRKRLQKTLGPTATINVEQYGDVIGVQTFSNSAPRHKAVRNSFSTFPRIIDIDLKEILE